MHIYGLTGGIASGKSTVSKILSDLGCPIIDADVIARQVVEPGKPAWKLIVGHFGVDMLRSDGHIDRPKLAQLIFEEQEKRHLLNACTHPFIQREMMWQVFKCFLRGENFIILVSPLLYESGRFLWMLKKTIVVNCSYQQQVERLMEREQLTESEAEKRIKSQMLLTEKCRKADMVVDNSQDRDAVHQEVVRLHRELTQLSSYRWLFRRVLLAVVVAIGILVYRIWF